MDQALLATVAVKTDTGSLGAGFCISPDGHILTNAHVLRNATKAWVETKNGKTLPITCVLLRSLDKDLALVKVEANNKAPFLRVADEGEYKVGDPVFCIGHPYGHTWTLSKGYIAGLRNEGGLRVVQIDASISPGSSGGPIITRDGKACGIVTFMERRVVEFERGKYAFDVSSMLNFGVDAVYFRGTLSKPQLFQQMDLAALGVRDRAAESLEKIAAVQVVADWILRSYVAAMNGLSIGKTRVYRGDQTTYWWSSVGWLPVDTRAVFDTQVDIGGAEPFARAALHIAALRALWADEFAGIQGSMGTYKLNEIRTCASDLDYALDLACESIDLVAKADRKTKSSAARKALVDARQKLEQATLTYYRSIEAGCTLYGALYPTMFSPPLSLQEVAELKRVWYENGDGIKVKR